MAMTLAEIREQYPQYDDVNDQQLVEGFHQKFYSDMEFDDFASRIGYKQEEIPTISPGTPEYQKNLQAAGSAVDAVSAAPLEAMAAVNRGATGLVDFGASLPNALLQLAGREERIPSLTEAMAPATAGNFMEEGLGKDVVRTAGEVAPAALSAGSLLRSASQRLPQMGRAAEDTVSGALREIGKTTAGQDIGYGALSGVGAEVGEKMGGTTGSMIGAIAAPLSAAGALSMARGAGRGMKSIADMRKPAETVDESTARVVSEFAEREGLTPEQVGARLQELGPEGILADTGDVFARNLRAAANELPAIEGQARQALSARQAGQGQRLSGALEDATSTQGLDVDEAITTLDEAIGPEVNQLYTAARQKSDAVLGGPQASEGYSFVSPKPTTLQKILDDKDIGQLTGGQVRRELTAKRLSGEPVTALDKIDATKRALDDQINKAIRDGKGNKARSLVQTKHRILDEADTAIPEYKQARDLFAGKANLENAAEQGELFLKMKPRDVEGAINTLSQSEKRMFQLGAKRAILDRLDFMQVSRDAVKGLFGKRGEARKLRALFDDERVFQDFSDTLEREAIFILTKRAAQANSTTAKQFADDQSLAQIVEVASAASGNPLSGAGVLARVADKAVGGRAKEQFEATMQRVGDILLDNGMPPTEIIDLIRSGNTAQIKSALTETLPKGASIGAAGFRGGAIGAVEPSIGVLEQVAD